MILDRISKESLRYVFFCSLVWAITLPVGVISGRLVGILLAWIRAVPWYIELDWKTNGALLGLILGGMIGGALTVHGLRRWLPEINRRQVFITGLGWVIALGSIVVLSIFLEFD